ncbi:MAG: glycosyltransferase, partial [Polyangiaceae bacterium]|nr:glycosyltransferase [Polyangiaceae bacterium]
RHLERRAEGLRSLFGGRAVWNISSTSAGGGVAEMLRAFLRYARGLGVDARWLVLEAQPDFFRVTKRVHNALHASVGDGSPLGPAETAIYDRAVQENALALDPLLRPGDVVVCHDPQTAGLVPHLMALGARVVWRCHIGYEGRNEEVDRAWGFLRPYLENVPVAVFTRAAYAPPWLHCHTLVLPPNIDPLSAKNQPLSDATVRAILVEVGLVSGDRGGGAPVFTRDDGTSGRVDRKVEVVGVGPRPPWDAPLVVQVSRWDSMKDPRGVLEGFACGVAPELPGAAQLVLAGPSLGSVADDPEGAEVFGEVEQAWRALPEALKRPVHLALLPMDDLEENAAIVNALQRHAAVIVQKSLQEGFGLTVTEAMWKRRPVVASDVGGIRDQVRDGVDGLLLRTPSDLGEFAAAVRRILCDASLAKRLGESGHERVRENYIIVSALERWADLFEDLLGRADSA